MSAVEGPERILVVDDEPHMRDMMAMTLRTDGYRVETAADGRQALSLLADHSFDLVITDLMMPDVSGLEVLAEVKKRLPTAEVILVTAYGSLESAVEALRQGAHDYLTKPFEPEQISYSVQRTLLYRRMKLDQLHQVHVRNALIEAGQRIATALDHQEVLRTVLEATIRVMPQVELAAIYYQSDERAKVTGVGLTGEGVPVEALPLDETLAEALAHQRTVYQPNWRPSQGLAQIFDAEGDKSRLIVPLLLTGTQRGALTVVARRAEAFGDDHRQVLTMLASQTAIALQNALLYAEARRVDELEVLYEAGQALNRTLDLQETLTTTLSIARSLTRASIGSVYLCRLEDERHRIDSVVTSGAEPSLSDADRQRSDEIARQVLTRTVEEIAHPSESPPGSRIVSEPVEANVPAAEKPAIQTWLGVPLITGESPVGVLVLGSDRANAFTPDDVRLMQVVASQSATAIENARLYEEVQQRWQQTEALRVISQSISNTLDQRRVLELVVRSAAKTIPAATHSTLYLREQGSGNFVPEAQVDRRHKPIPQGLEAIRQQAIRQATRQRKPVRVAWRDEGGEEADSWSLMAAPLTVGESVIGAISVASPSPEAFSSNDETLLNTFASHASIAIQNANLFRELSSAYIDLANHQEEILRQHRTLQALFDSITDGLYIVDRDMRIVAINRAEAQRLNETPESLVGRRCDSSLWGEATSKVTTLVLNTFETGREGNWESQPDAISRGPFTERDVRTYPIFNRKGEVGQVILFAQDVSEKQRLQASLFRSANMAAVGQLASSIAHEINNPLTVIIASAQLMQLEIERDSPDYPVIESIVEAGMRIRRIVQNLLDFSSQESYDWYETDVQATIEDALTFIAHPLRKGNIEVVKQMEELPGIIASANHLKLLWMNLLLNARDAILARDGLQDERRVIEIRARRKDANHVQVQIADNGVGLSPQQRDRLFHPFFTTKPPGKGLGLGLYTCRTIVERHQGHIEIENNREGPGVTATVTLPIHPEPPLNSAE